MIPLVNSLTMIQLAKNIGFYFLLLIHVVIILLHQILVS